MVYLPWFVELTCRLGAVLTRELDKARGYRPEVRWKPTARGVLPVLALLVLAAGIYTVFSVSPAAATAPTVVRTVGPLEPSGALKASYQVTRRLGHGTCQLGSFQTGSAYRCSSPQAGSVLLDPCWPLATATSTMVCQEKPWQAQVIELHVTGTATGGPSSDPTALPWGVRIGANVRCLRDVGAVLRVDGNLLAYHCSHHRDVIGSIQASGTTWRAHVYRTGARTATGEKSIGWQGITIAWRGAALVAPQPPTTPAPTATATTTDPPTPTATATATATPTTTATPTD
jgi:hypothetical protein